MLNLHCTNDNKLRLLSAIVLGFTTIAFQLLSTLHGSQGPLLRTQASCVKDIDLSHPDTDYSKERKQPIKPFYSGGVDCPLLLCGWNSQNFVLGQCEERQAKQYGVKLSSEQ